MIEYEKSGFIWETKLRPGYLGSKKDQMYEKWNSPDVYGKGNWRIVNETARGEIFNYEDVIYKVYVPGYEAYFLSHPHEAVFITDNFSYGYDKNLVSKTQAFDIYALYNTEGIPNQFHHVAFNIALTERLRLSFKGRKPLQVRESKPNTPDILQPRGFRWSPGRIPCTIPEEIPTPHLEGWWSYNSIEDFYQSTKVLQIKI